MNQDASNASIVPPIVTIDLTKNESISPPVVTIDLTNFGNNINNNNNKLENDKMKQEDPIRFTNIPAEKNLSSEFQQLNDKTNKEDTFSYFTREYGSLQNVFKNDDRDSQKDIDKKNDVEVKKKEKGQGKEKEKHYPRCAGSWIFTRDLSRVLLIMTHNGRYGTAKGTFDSKLGDVTMQDNRDREVREECGLSPEHLEYVPEIHFIDEIKKSKHPNKPDKATVRYWVALLKDDSHELLVKPIDTHEIQHARFYSIEKATQLLTDHAKKSKLPIFQLALKLAIAHKTSTPMPVINHL